MCSLFSGKDALIVGGTGGIGREMAALLAQRGANIAVAGRFGARLDAARSAGYRALQVDAIAAGAVERMLDFAGRQDILVCAWGPFVRAPLSGTTAACWEALVHGNLTVPGSLVSGLLPGMMERRFGRILLFGGAATDTVRGFLTTACYSAAKTALGSLAKSVARQAGPLGVHCNVLCPGFTITEYTSDQALAYYHEKAADSQVFTARQTAALGVSILESDCLNGAVIDGSGGVSL
jgi:NAD(P)-dependent dehydrogenase (short-subunit alcohol dehydrogenase family)